MYMRGRLAAMALRPIVQRQLALRPALVIGSSAWRRIDHGVLRQVVAGRAWDSTIAMPPSDPVAPAAADATENTIAEEKDTGHFEVKENEAILFFDSTCFALKLLGGKH